MSINQLNGPKHQHKLYVRPCAHALCNEFLSHSGFKISHIRFLKYGLLLFVCSFSLVKVSFKSWPPLSDNVILNSGMSHSYSTQRDNKNLVKLTGYGANSRRFDDRNSESSSLLANQVDSCMYLLS